MAGSARLSHFCPILSLAPGSRVRLDTETHHDEREVSEEVRKEQIELDDSSRR